MRKVAFLMEEKVRIKFWGTGGSSWCGVCGSNLHREQLWWEKTKWFQSYYQDSELSCELPSEEPYYLLAKYNRLKPYL